jgi:thiopeptide-type bacteriocin biosynthesis protein
LPFVLIGIIFNIERQRLQRILPMTNYFFAEHLLLRMPANSWDTYHFDGQGHLNNLYFNAALYIASPLFYNCLEQKNFQYAELSEKEQLTLQKYLNRFCFRPTPFGLFAGVTLIRWGEQSGFDLNAIRPEDAIIIPDQACVLKIAEELFQNEMKSEGLYEPNPTIYRLLEELRFISTEIDKQDHLRRYLLQSTDYSKVLKGISLFCKVPKSREEMVKEICRLANCTLAIGEDYFEFLIQEQLFVQRYRPNINGPGYLGLLLDHDSLAIKPSVRTLELNQILDGLKTAKVINASWFKQINNRLSESIAPAPGNAKPNHLQVILNRKIDSGTLDMSYKKMISDGLFALNKLCPEETVTGMVQFVKAFQRNFEGQTLDLLYALDPEVGIGYSIMAPAKENDLLETLNISPKRKMDHAASWTPAHSFLLALWHNAPGKRVPVIRLEEADLIALHSGPEASNTTGLSVLFRIFNDQLYLESAGGVNSPALMGRFTVADPDIAQAARQIAQRQEADNPDLIFAEILHLAGPHTDNVNRREHVWSYDLPVTAVSTLPEERQLALADLKVRIENNKVILYSEKHRKVVIPRLTSAYNHAIDKLPLFRFLADVPYQYSRFGLEFDLRSFFPGLSYYPRVTYKNTILYLATWIVTEAQIKSIAKKEVPDLLASFRDLAKELFLPPAFSLVEGDQQLVFYRDREKDVLFFVACIKQKSEVVLKEHLLEDSDNTLVKDQNGRGMTSQFNTYLLPVKPIVIVPPGFAVSVTKKLQRKFMPGSEWLYLKIYTSKIGVKRLLLKVLPLIRRRYTTDPLKKWFFIRYDDHAPHIRLRMQIDPQDIGNILIAFKELLEDGVNQHVIREYQIDVYSRELERYEAGGIAASEDLFWASSELAVKFFRLQDKGSALLIYQVALRTALDMIRTFLPDPVAQLQFAAASYRQFFPEFEENKLRVEMDKKYRELSIHLRLFLNDADFYSSSGLQKTGGQFIKTIHVLVTVVQIHKNDNGDFLRSLVHMHLNRLFTDEPRKQEMIVYYLLHKFLTAEQARAKNMEMSS